MVFNATFNNISVISWRSVLLVEETRVPEENHRPVASHCQTLSHNIQEFHRSFRYLTVQLFSPFKSSSHDITEHLRNVTINNNSIVFLLTSGIFEWGVTLVNCLIAQPWL